MGRAAFAFGTPDRGAGVVDGSTGGLLCTVEWSSGDSSLGPPGAGPILPGPTACPQESSPDEDSRSQQELKHIWLQLSAPDRQRFGHCFSFMVLKALGLRPCPTQEVEA
jgi:hypothetical protein